MAKMELAKLVKKQAYGPSEEGQQFAKEFGKFLFRVHFFPNELEMLVEGRQRVMESKGRSARSGTFNVECLTPPAVMTGDGDGVLHKRCSIQMMEVLVVSLWCVFSKGYIPLAMFAYGPATGPSSCMSLKTEITFATFWNFLILRGKWQAWVFLPHACCDFQESVAFVRRHFFSPQYRSQIKRNKTPYSYYRYEKIGAAAFLTLQAEPLWIFVVEAGFTLFCTMWRVAPWHLGKFGVVDCFSFSCGRMQSFSGWVFHVQFPRSKGLPRWHVSGYIIFLEAFKSGSFIEFTESWQHEVRITAKLIDWKHPTERQELVELIRRAVDDSGDVGETQGVSEEWKGAECTTMCSSLSMLTFCMWIIVDKDEWDFDDICILLFIMISIYSIYIYLCEICT